MFHLEKKSLPSSSICIIMYSYKFEGFCLSFGRVRILWNSKDMAMYFSYFIRHQFQMIEILSMFGFIHELWTISIVNMMYTRSQNFTNMVVGQHGIQTFKVVLVVLLLLLLSLDILSPQVHIPYYF